MKIIITVPAGFRAAIYTEAERCGVLPSQLVRAMLLGALASRKNSTKKASRG